MTDRSIAWGNPHFSIRPIIRTLHGQAITMLLFLSESGATSKERSLLPSEVACAVAALLPHAQLCSCAKR